ncbi:hypothetical protein [Roseateles albus]|uniref:Uncharacterized protein n=1 Tax=Roseateles albus TaxID=2987525 RepID=A0ABT5KE22_9BURK|nr:hypothetical protein [Roseateles albus]MDC8771784.1 hypothetical protein [Roseateles albus]
MDPDLLQLLVSGGVWRTASVSEAPQIVLESWTVRQLENGDRHFVGWNCTHHEGRASSKIVQFDPVTLRGVTRSGRVYELRGKPGHDRDAEHVWASWLRINGKPAWTDVTPETPEAAFARMCAEKSRELAMTELAEDGDAAADFARMNPEKTDDAESRALEQEVPVAKDFGPFRGRRR